eukprot:gene698-28900_t
MAQHLALWTVVLMQATLCACRQVVFDNTKPRLDSTGSILKAHDGTTQRFAAAAVATPLDGVGGGSSSNLFYYHAMGYPACNETGRINGCNYDPVYGKGAKTCIYGHNNSLLVYSSPDLSSGSWKLEDTVYPGHSGFPECTYFRSQAVYNPSTQKYVLWANVAGCRNGPFTFVGTTEPTAASMQHTGGIGDYALFVDTDNDGAGTSSVGPLPGPHLVEAPAMFQREGTYYALLGGCTCMGLYGGGVAMLTAKHPLGPWTNVTSVLDPGCPMQKQTTCFEMGPGQVCNPVTQAQQNYVIEVPLANGSTAFIWTGDKCFDADGNILPLEMVDRFELDVAE